MYFTSHSFTITNFTKHCSCTITLTSQGENGSRGLKQGCGNGL